MIIILMFRSNYLFFTTSYVRSAITIPIESALVVWVHHEKCLTVDPDPPRRRHVELREEFIFGNYKKIYENGKMLDEMTLRILQDRGLLRWVGGIAQSLPELEVSQKFITKSITYNMPGVVKCL